MAPVVGPHHVRYDDFYNSWTQKQEDLMKQLKDALDSDIKEDDLQKLISTVEDHYDLYYDMKDDAAQQDILQVVTPPWKSPLERAFLWFGGWRPSMAFQLLYALAGRQIEVELAEVLEGIDTPTLASLSASQLSQISELQSSTCKEEEIIGDSMALLQQSIADEPLLSLSQADGIQRQSADEDLKKAVKEKLIKLEESSIQADALRRRTLKKVLNILTTLQRAQYLVAAAQLQIALRHLGEKLNTDKEASLYL